MQPGGTRTYDLGGASGPGRAVPAGAALVLGAVGLVLGLARDGYPLAVRLVLAVAGAALAVAGVLVAVRPHVAPADPVRLDVGPRGVGFAGPRAAWTCGWQELEAVEVVEYRRATAPGSGPRSPWAYAEVHLATAGGVRSVVLGGAAGPATLGLLAAVRRYRPDLEVVTTGSAALPRYERRARAQSRRARGHGPATP